MKASLSQVRIYSMKRRLPNEETKKKRKRNLDDNNNDKSNGKKRHIYYSNKYILVYPTKPLA